MCVLTGLQVDSKTKELAHLQPNLLFEMAENGALLAFMPLLSQCEAAGHEKYLSNRAPASQKGNAPDLDPGFRITGGMRVTGKIRYLFWGRSVFRIEHAGTGKDERARRRNREKKGNVGKRCPLSGKEQGVGKTVGVPVFGRAVNHVGCR